MKSIILMKPLIYIKVGLRKKGGNVEELNIFDLKEIS